MASTVFTDKVTMVPADWANDVNRLTYDVFANAADVPAVLAALGLDWAVQSGLEATIVDSTIDRSVIGGTVPAAGTFTTLKVTTQGTGATDVASVAWVQSQIGTFQGTIGTLGYQNADAIAVTGGTLDGTVIGGTTPAAGTFTSLKTAVAPTAASDVANKAYVDGAIAALPAVGTLGLQDYDAALITGGTIDGVVIGATAPAAATFTNVSATKVLGPDGSLYLDGGLTGYATRGWLLTSTAGKPDGTLLISAGGTLTVETPPGTKLLQVLAAGRILMGATDDTTTRLQVVGGIKSDTVLLTGAITQATQAATKQYADGILTQANTYADSATAAALATLGTMATQNANAIAVTGGTLDNVVIGNTTPNGARFLTAEVSTAPANPNDVVNKSYLDAQIAALPTYGTMASQNADAVAITGGHMDNVVIGGTVRANAAFLNITANVVSGIGGAVHLDGTPAGYFNYGVVLAASLIQPNVGIQLGMNGSLHIKDSDSNELVSLIGGRLVLNQTDDTTNRLQVTGGASFDKLLLSAPVTATQQAATKQYVDVADAAVLATVDAKIATAVANLGSMALQDSDSVNITGGNINGTTIGATQPAVGRFTTISANIVNGNGGNILFDQTARLQAIVLQAASINKPNIEAWITTGGAYSIMNGTQVLAQTLASGRTLFGITATDDGSSILQVAGQARVSGQLLIPQAPATANSATNKAYVDAQIASVSGSTVTPQYVQDYVANALIPYATQAYVNNAISGFVTQPTVAAMISNALASYSTTVQMNNAISTALTPYATQVYVQNYVASQVGTYATQAYVQSYVTSQLVGYATENYVQDYVTNNAVSPTSLASATGATMVGFGGTTVSAALTAIQSSGIGVAQNPNLVYAGPPSGGTAVPSFRALVTADLPANIAASTITASTSVTSASVTTANISGTGGNLTIGGVTLFTNSVTIPTLTVSNGGSPFTMTVAGGTGGADPAALAISSGNVGQATLTVGAIATFNGPVTVSAATNINSTLAVTGTSTFGSQMTAKTIVPNATGGPYDLGAAGALWGTVYATTVSTGSVRRTSDAAATPATGATVTVATETVYIDPAGTIAALTISLPAAADGQEVRLVFSQSVTAVTWVRAGGATMGTEVPTAVTAGAGAGFVIRLRYRQTANQWRLC